MEFLRPRFSDLVSVFSRFELCWSSLKANLKSDISKNSYQLLNYNSWSILYYKLSFCSELSLETCVLHVISS